MADLGKVLNAGPAPTVTVTGPKSGSRTDAAIVEATARVTDRGKGIGRIEWRVNGITAGVSSVPAGAGPDYGIKQSLALDPGPNGIEAIAYERRNVFASPPGSTLIFQTGPASTAKPKLYVLAIGINSYRDKGTAPPGQRRSAGISAACLVRLRCQGIQLRNGQGWPGGILGSPCDAAAR